MGEWIPRDMDDSGLSHSAAFLLLLYRAFSVVLAEVPSATGIVRELVMLGAPEIVAICSLETPL